MHLLGGAQRGHAARLQNQLAIGFVHRQITQRASDTSLHDGVRRVHLPTRDTREGYLAEAVIGGHGDNGEAVLLTLAACTSD